MDARPDATWKLSHVVDSPVDSIAVWESTASRDDRWDNWLGRIPAGHFQATSTWAQVKAAEHWQAIRLTLTRDDRLVGGYQMLWRSGFPLGDIAYITKGPAFDSDDPTLIQLCIREMSRMARQRRILALVVQPPDNGVNFVEPALAAGFKVDRLMGVITANLVVSLEGGLPAVESRMSAEARKHIRQALKRGLVVREGGEADMGSFFALMKATCARQGVTPNPSNETALLQMWRLFRAAGQIRLTLAELDGKPVAGQLALPFGSRVTLWKKGWAGSEANRRPNHLLLYESLQWASAQGCTSVDFAGLNPAIAQALNNGRPLNDTQEESWDSFNVGFGGVPVLLPPALIFFRNPALRLAYRGLACVWRRWPRTRKPFRRLVQNG
jgi:lipid II:glycine glycyltransferase (peptidoglycan interpeptide bridge formation enzyme)